MKLLNALSVCKSKDRNGLQHLSKVDIPFFLRLVYIRLDIYFNGLRYVSIFQASYLPAQIFLIKCYISFIPQDVYNNDIYPLLRFLHVYVQVLGPMVSWSCCQASLIPLCQKPYPRCQLSMDV